jgi:excisionase family DNA binding protein
MLPDPREQPTLDVEQAAALLGVSRAACYRAVQRGDIPALRFGRSWRVVTAGLLKLLLVDGASDGPGDDTPGLRAVRS